MTLDWAIHRGGETDVGTLEVPDDLDEKELIRIALDEFRRMQEETE